MAGARADELTGFRVDGHVDERDELLGRQLAERDLVGELEEVARLGVLARQRAEDELRHRHVGRGIDAVAGHVAERDGEPAVRQGEEVVHVPADLDTPRRGVHRADVEAGDVGLRARQQRTLHRVRERLLLLVQARAVDRDRGLAHDRVGQLERPARDRPRRVEREQGQGREQLGGRQHRDDGAGRSTLEEGNEQLVGRAQVACRLGIEDERTSGPEQAPARQLRHRLWPPQNRPDRPFEPRFRHVDPRSQELVTSLVRQS